MASRKATKPAAAGGGLPALRARIDELNIRIVRALSQRARLAQEVWEIKRAEGASAYQPARERAVLESVAAANPGPLSDEQIRRIFGEIIAACRALEQELRVAYLGPEHTYSHEAARAHFGASAEFAAQTSIAGVFGAIENGRADFGVVPVENSTEGSVTLTLDLLIDTPLQVVGELLLPVRHALASRSGDPRAIAMIVSHQQSLGQCRGYLAANFPSAKLEAVASNALAAQRAAEDASAAAIASVTAAGAYGLKVIAENIQDAPHNTTRFLVIGREPVAPSGADKTSVVFAVPERVGALNWALSLFARNSINLTMIQSRPQRARPWEYVFFVDLQGHREDPKLRRALEALKRRALLLKVLGSYPEGRLAGV
ncbi:MAG TPA: prephenate dehydratase [Candidatus Binataceae bacterium]|nr:prephenate dehydratase [Candidatus Binataceae bacterium]